LKINSEIVKKVADSQWKNPGYMLPDTTTGEEVSEQNFRNEGKTKKTSLLGKIPPLPAVTLSIRRASPH
jgi:hypothetical protein